MKFYICLINFSLSAAWLNLSQYENKYLMLIMSILMALITLYTIFFVKEDEMFANIKVIKKEQENDK